MEAEAKRSHRTASEKVSGDFRKRRFLLRLMVALELGLILLAIFSAAVPVLDYANKEYRAYVSHPSQETLDAFHAKQREEESVRLRIALFFGVCAGLLAIPLARTRKRLKGSA